MPGQLPVLLVVKKERNSELLDQLLDSKGYAVRTASTVRETDELLSETDDVTVTIVDIDGFTTDILSRVRILNENDIPVVLLTRSPAELRRCSLDSTVEVTLQKPVQKRSLLDALQRIAEVNESDSTTERETP